MYQPDPLRETLNYVQTNKSKYSVKSPSTIMPICILKSQNRENEIPSEFDGEKSIYKSFLDEYYTVRSHQSPQTKFQKKKIFDNIEIEKPITTYDQINKQEVQKMLEPVSISHHQFLETQTKLLSTELLQKFKHQCMKDAKQEIISVLHTNQLQIDLKVISHRQKLLNCQLLFNNRGQSVIIDMIYTSDQTLRLSKYDDRLNLQPNSVTTSNLDIEIVSIPFTLINVSIEFNGQFYSVQMPITILNFIEEQQILKEPTLRTFNHSNKLISKKLLNNKILIGKVCGRDFEFVITQENGKSIFICKNETEQVNWQMLNTFYFLYDI